MCGIAGILSTDPSVRERLPRALDAIAHRGPDDEGRAEFPGAVLGHRRLSILDLETGRQPIVDPEKRRAIVFNGEIYNFHDLREELSREGYPFRTRSEAEVLLHLYDKMGERCVERLDGMFAFAIWDEPRGRLLLARDPMGQKPLFHLETTAGGAPCFIFASEVKAILATGLHAPRVDLEALYHYVSLRTIPDRLTLFSGIAKLPAGHLLVRERDGTTRITRYWKLAFGPRLEGTDEEILDRLEERLRETVRAHLLADVPVGAFLSGGIDSSLITALAATESASRRPFPTFSIGVREEEFDELPYARLVAARYGTDHHEEVVSADLVHLVPRMVWHMDEPSDPFAAGVYLASRLAARHVKVVLSGDGGDELFAGYDRFSGNRLADRLRVVPAPVRRTVLRKMIDLVPESYGYKGLSHRLRWVNEMSLLSEGERYAESLSWLRFTEAAKRRLFTGDALGRIGALDSRAKILEHFDGATGCDEIERMLYTDLSTRMPDHLLAIVDRMSMAHGLEVRPPLLEHRMVEFACRVPSRLKLRGRTLKYALRRIAARHLDAALVDRPKQGFGFPLARWMREELAELLREMVRSSRMVEEGIFRREALRELVDEHTGGRRDHNYRLWVLLNLEVWHRLHLEGEGIESVIEWIERASEREARHEPARA